MRNLLAFLAAAVLAFLGLGWYLDWYKVQAVPNGASGHQSFNIEVNNNKITKDVKKGVEKGEQKIQEVMDKKSSESKPAEAPENAVQKAGSLLQRFGGSQEESQTDRTSAPEKP